MSEGTIDWGFPGLTSVCVDGVYPKLEDAYAVDDEINHVCLCMPTVKAREHFREGSMVRLQADVEGKDAIDGPYFVKEIKCHTRGKHHEAIVVLTR